MSLAFSWINLYLILLETFDIGARIRSSCLIACLLINTLLRVNWIGRNMLIGIVTINSHNYGNRLQNYALQEVLKKRGHEVATIRRKKWGLWDRSKKFVRRVVKNDSFNAFYDFDDCYIRYSELVLSRQYTDERVYRAFDKYVIGSDQVWNPTFSFNSDLDYLPEVESKKKMSYAASFGVSQIPEGDAGRIADLLRAIPHISVRENAGAAIVKSLADREVPVVLDPTLLLDVEEWKKVSNRPRFIDVSDKYIVKYMLGSDVNADIVSDFAAENKYRVIDVFDKKLKIGPSEFVWLIANCEMVCTDSFHASVFALLHHRPFAIFERVSSDKDMSSRFDTLCSLFDVEANRASSAGFSMRDSFKTDWSAFEKRLSDLRRMSNEWLDYGLSA